MSKKYLIILFIGAVAVGAITFIFKYYVKDSTDLTVSVNEFGPLKIGDDTISGPGDWTFAPYIKIPAAKFYVTVVTDKFWCSNDDCGLDGALIQTMGGWLQADSVNNNPDLSSMSGLDLKWNRNVKAIVFIGNKDGKIVGIYPNRTLNDVLDILKKHPNLADFSLLNGVDMLGSLKVGEFAPLKPGDNLSYLSDKLLNNSATSVPKGKDFYIYALQKRKYDIVGIRDKYENKYVCLPGGCRYPEPDPPHDFLFDDIDKLNGWFLANNVEDVKMIELFGLDSQEVISGASSLVVLTDSRGVIASIHPNKTISDALSILSQHSDLVNVSPSRTPLDGG